LTSGVSDGSTGAVEGLPDTVEDKQDSTNMIALAAIVLSGLGFLTLLKLADRRDRSPATALGLFLATSLETVGGTALGLVAASRASDSEQPSKGLVLGAAAAVLGVIASIMNFNWMRTRRRL
jgi:hypothetical protein